LERFVVGKEDVGEVQFLQPVNVLGVDLDNIVDIEKGKIQVYSPAMGQPCPNPGEFLNVPALLIFR
jgi:Nucleoporin autopeptidase